MKQTKCDRCIHDDVCGCMMKDCIRNEGLDKFMAEMDTNNLRDRFVDKDAVWKDKE